MKFARRHPDHHDVLMVQPNGAPQDGAVSAELLVLEAVAQDRDRPGAGFVVLIGPEVAAKRRPDTHNVEEVPVNEFAKYLAARV